MKRIYMIICIAILIIFKELNGTQVAIFLIEAFVTLYVCTKGRAFTNKGRKLKSKIEEYEEYLLSNKLLSQNKIVDFILQEKDYINSIALHIQSNARDGFIDTEIVDGSAKNYEYSSTKYTVYSITICNVFNNDINLKIILSE